MTGKTHLMTGALVATSVLAVTHLQLSPIEVIVGSMLGSKAPDLDMLFGSHRKFTHSLLGICVAFGVSYLVSPIFAVFFSLACLIHVLMDSCTVMGVPFLYPFNKKKYGLKFIKTGGAEDLYLCLMLFFLISCIIAKV